MKDDVYDLLQFVAYTTKEQEKNCYY